MAYLIAILIYLGIISSPTEATEQIIDDNRSLIEEVDGEILIIDDGII